MSAIPEPELTILRDEVAAERAAEWHRPVCPNLDDPVLCNYWNGVFVPECGCPVHGPDEPKEAS